MRPSDYTNNSHIIRQFEHMVAINSAIQVDLSGQVCAESLGPTLFSGVGGQMDFLARTGALRTGPAHHCYALSTARLPTIPAAETNSTPLESTHAPDMLEARDGCVSRIVPFLTPGAAVTTSRAHVH